MYTNLCFKKLNAVSIIDCIHPQDNCILFVNTEEPRNKASANKENPSIPTKILGPQMLFLLILYIGSKASFAIRHEIDWSLEMRYCT